MTAATLAQFRTWVDYLEQVRLRYMENKDKADWYDLIQLLPTSYDQKRTVTLNYEVLAGPEAFVIGGAGVYRAMLPWCVQAYVTRVEEAFPADCWMVDLDRAPEWRLAERSALIQEQGLHYRFARYVRE